MTDQQDITLAPIGSRPTMDVAEAAALLGVSPWLVLQQIAKGILPHKRFGRRIIIPRAAFLTWLEHVDEPAERSPAGGQAHVQRRAWGSAAEAS